MTGSGDAMNPVSTRRAASCGGPTLPLDAPIVVPVHPCTVFSAGVPGRVQRIDRDDPSGDGHLLQECQHDRPRR